MRRVAKWFWNVFLHIASFLPTLAVLLVFLRVVQPHVEERTGSWFFRGVELLPQPPTPMFLLGLLIVYGLLLFCYLQYRFVRQREFLDVVALAVDQKLPVTASLDGYLQERPRSWVREVFLFFGLGLAFPTYYLYRVRFGTYDQKMQRVLQRLEQGVPLSQALGSEPRLATAETVLAVAVGEISGRMSESLQKLQRRSVGASLLESLPRLFYPAFLLLVMLSALMFLNYFIFPKYEKIIVDLKLKMPWLTDWCIVVVRFLGKLGVILWILPLVAGFSLLWHSNSTVRWFWPILGRFYRLHQRSRVLNFLGLLTGVGKPAPEALRVLADEGRLPSEVSLRVRGTLQRIEQGEALGPSLEAAGLLPANMTALVVAAERAQHLPWALQELSLSLMNSFHRRVERWTFSLFPILIVLVGALIGLAVLGVFLPIVEMLWQLD